jgi:signal transduction histidine kinase
MEKTEPLIAEETPGPEPRADPAELRQFIRSAPVAVAAFDREMGYIEASARWISEFRLGDIELRGASHFGLFPELRERWTEPHLRAIHGAPERCEEDLLPLGDGSREFMCWEMAPWFDGCGAVAGVVMSAHTITPRKRMEAELSRANRALRAISRSKHAVLEAETEAGLLQEICDAVVQVAGYRVAWVGLAENDARKSVRRVAASGLDADVIDALEISWSDSERGRGPTGTAIRTGHPATVHDMKTDPRMAVWRTDANRTGIVAGIALPLLLEGRVFGALSIYASENDSFDPGEVDLLAELAADLVGGIRALREHATREEAERSRQALEEQLRQAQKMEALGTLAGGVAHDFNNILTGIVGNLQLAEMDLPAGHPASGALSEAFKASRRARDLVSRILTFSRRETNDRQVADLAPIVEEAVQLLTATLPKTIEIRREVDPGCPRVLCCLPQIHQVILNLGMNAAHAMGASSGVLGVRLRGGSPAPSVREANPRLGSGPCAVLSVRDTGCGMDAAVLKRIFEPFFTTKPAGQGTGLGLAMVHGIVGSHGGSIEVDSLTGVGTCFDIYLPAAQI